jgi:hypothetical protein
MRLNTLQNSVDLQFMIDNDLFLSLHILLLIKYVPKITSNNDDDEHMDCLRQLHFKLMLKETTSENHEALQIMLWMFIIASYIYMIKHHNATIKEVGIIANDFHEIFIKERGVLEAFGLKKSKESNKKKVLLECLSCVLYAVMNDVGRHENSMAELRNVIFQGKKYSELKVHVQQVVMIIENKMTEGNIFNDYIETIFKIFKIFYGDTCNYLNSIEDVYNW